MAGIATQMLLDLTRGTSRRPAGSTWSPSWSSGRAPHPRQPQLTPALRGSVPHSTPALDDLQRYAPEVDEPDDFDEFWRDTLAEAAAVPVLVDVRPEPTDLRLLDSWDVTFAGFGGEPVRAWYTRPAGVREPLPAVVEYAGYGRGRGLPHERLTWPVAGYAHLLMDNRGQAGQHGAGDTPTRTARPAGPGRPPGDPRSAGLPLPSSDHRRGPGGRGGARSSGSRR
ncbi:acetylxylan esterase [Micromonospora sp. M12]